MTLARSLLGGDLHVTTELRVDDRWVVYDPTFHVTFEKDGVQLGAVDIHRELLENGAVDVLPRFHGAVAHPTRLEGYYVHWRPLYNHVLHFSEGAETAWAPLPPFRYWWGPRWYFLEGQEGEGLWYGRLGDRVYFAVVVVLPLLLLVLALAAAGWWALGRLTRKRAPPAASPRAT